jgi:hypothetical protein
MSRLAREEGARFLVTLSPTNMNAVTDNPPWRIASFLQEYQDDARAKGVPAIHCMSEYLTKGGAGRLALRLDPYHLNPQGNTLIAETTKRWLLDNAPAPSMAAIP